MSNVNKSGFLANWIDDFVTGLAGKEIVAIKNKEDLDTVSWENETYHVDVVEKEGKESAIIYNDFNYPRVLDDVSTVEEVDDEFNKNVVVSTESSDDEHNAKYYVPESKQSNKPDFQIVESALKKIADDLNTPSARHIVDRERMDKYKTDISLDSNGSEFLFDIENESMENNHNDSSKVDELEKKVAELTEKVLYLEQQLYARNDSFEDVDLHTQDKEVEIFNDSWKKTRDEIEFEHSFDYTTPSGRYEYYKTKKERMENQNDENNYGCPVCENDDCVCYKGDSVYCPVCENKSCICKQMNQSATMLDSFEKLSGPSVQVFKKGLCPFTNNSLIKSRVSGNYVGVCSDCGKEEYAVDLNTGDIYRYMG